MCCHEMWSDILFEYDVAFTSLSKLNKKQKNPATPINKVK